MSKGRILRRLRRHPLALVAAALVLASGLAVTGTTFASFTAETQNSTSTLAGGWIGAASNLNISASGYDAQLAWTPGTHAVTGQQLWAYDNGSSSSCPSSGYTQLATMASATTSSHTATNSSSVSGHYYCYEMVGTSSSSWTATASFPAVRLGLFLTAVAINNGNQPGKPDNGDAVTVTFNQQTTLTSTAGGASAVCTFFDAAGNVTFLLGDTTCSNASTDPYDVKLSGVTSTKTNTRQSLNATRTVSLSAPWTVTYALTSSGQPVNDGTWTVSPSSSVVSANGGADQAAACASCTLTAPQPGF